MRFLTTPECVAWCSQLAPAAKALPGPPAQELYVCHDFSIPTDAHRRVALCRTLWNVSGERMPSERLIWITEWSVWPSGEHMPLFSRWRRSFGEAASIKEKPGHLVDATDQEDGLSVIVVAALFLWDCWVYSGDTVVMLSNDERGSVWEPRSHPASKTQSQLEKLGVLGDR